MPESKRRTWTNSDVTIMRQMARRKQMARKIAKRLRRSEGATRQKALQIGLSLDSRG